MDPEKLFDYIKIFFIDSEKYNEIPDKIKDKHFFMLNRFMSIKYPKTSFELSKIGINTVYATDLWHSLVSSYRSVPQWIYTSTKGEKTKKEYLPDKKVIELYCEQNEIGISILKKAIMYNEKEIKKVEREFKKFIKAKK